jgi:hypothetical protein
MASLKKLSKPRPPDSTSTNGAPLTGPKPDTLGPNVGGGQKK